ncbi:putative ATP-dependent RNA helicase ddx31 [Diplonema papillatum]|nr:putative ATP-dependent RNA helicase ddx31 [Diplonema papillatum]
MVMKKVTKKKRPAPSELPEADAAEGNGETDAAAPMETEKAPAAPAAAAAAAAPVVAAEPAADGEAEPTSIFEERAIEGLDINGRLKEGLALQGFKHLTKVQRQAFDPIMAEGDVLIRSATGSGKTVAYLLPLIQRILNWTADNRIDRSYGTLALFLVPTHELAEQCHAVLRKLCQKIPFLVTGCVKGGEQKKKEKARLRHGVHLLVSTVGRLEDHLRTTHAFNVSRLQFIVFDEADRLLDMGYEVTITKIKDILTQRRAPLEKSILVSATLSNAIKRLSHYVLRNPTVIGEGESGDSFNDDNHARPAGAGDANTTDAPAPGAPAAEAWDASQDYTHDDHDQYLGYEQQQHQQQQQQEDTSAIRVCAPESLTQHYLVAPTKHRLILLLSLLRWKMQERPADGAAHAPAASNYTASRSHTVLMTKAHKPAPNQQALPNHAAPGTGGGGAGGKGSKLAVFFSSADAVEYYYLLFSNLRVADPEAKAKRNATPADKRAVAAGKLKKKAQKRMIRLANEHLNDSDSEGYQEFDDGGADDDEPVSDFEEAPAPKGARAGGDRSQGKDWRGKEVRDEEEDEADLAPFLPFQLFKLHGNMTQLDRTGVFDAFRAAESGILLATDVASRGLDMPGIQWCIQFDPAADEKLYTHRIGRTARAGNKGDSIVFVQEHEKPYVAAVKAVFDPPREVHEMSWQLVLFQLAKALGGSHLLETAAYLNTRIERTVARDYELRHLSAVAYHGYLRAYTSYAKHLSSMFSVRNLHLGHVAKSFGIVKNPSNLRDLAHESSRGETYEPALVRKAKHAERFREGGTGKTREEEETAAAKKAFRKPIATSRVGQFSEFESGIQEAPEPARKKKKKQ